MFSKKKAYNNICWKRTKTKNRKMSRKWLKQVKQENI